MSYEQMIPNVQIVLLLLLCYWEVDWVDIAVLCKLVLLMFYCLRQIVKLNCKNLEDLLFSFSCSTIIRFKNVWPMHYILARVGLCQSFPQLLNFWLNSEVSRHSRSFSLVRFLFCSFIFCTFINQVQSHPRFMPTFHTYLNTLNSGGVEGSIIIAADPSLFWGLYSRNKYSILHNLTIRAAVLWLKVSSLWQAIWDPEPLRKAIHSIFTNRWRRSKHSSININFLW